MLVHRHTSTPEQLTAVQTVFALCYACLWQQQKQAIDNNVKCARETKRESEKKTSHNRGYLCTDGVATFAKPIEIQLNR